MLHEANGPHVSRNILPSYVSGNLLISRIFSSIVPHDFEDVGNGCSAHLQQEEGGQSDPGSVIERY